MTLIQVIDKARSLLNEPLATARTFPDETSSFWADSILVNYFNLIQEEVQNEIIQTFEDYFVTQTSIDIQDGRAGYTLPTDLIKVRRVEDIRDDHPIEIVPIKFSDKDRFFPGQHISGGFVDGYFLKGNEIVFSDTPSFDANSGVLLHYVKRLADLANASDISEIPREHHRVLVYGVVKLALEQQQSDNNFAQIAFERQLRKTIQSAENRQVQRPRKVRRVKHG